MVWENGDTIIPLLKILVYLANYIHNQKNQNMKKKTTLSALLPLVLILALLAPGCKKSTSGGTASSYKVKTIVSSVTQSGSTTNDSITYVYDASGRLVADVHSGGASESVVYNGSTFTLTTYHYPNPYTGHLNTQGLVSSITTPTIPAGSFYISNFNYDNNGYFINGNSLTGSNPTDTTVDTYTNNNLVHEDFGSLGFNTNTYSSTTEYRDFGFSGIYNSLNGPDVWCGTVFGHNSKNLISSSIDDTGATTTFTYTFDSYGRVVTETQTSPGNVTSLRFTYY